MTARHELAVFKDELLEGFKSTLIEQLVGNCPGCSMPYPREHKSEALTLTAIDAGFFDDDTLAGLTAEHFHNGQHRAIATVLIPLAKPGQYVNRPVLLGGLEVEGDERTAEAWRKLFATFDTLQPTMRGEPIRGHVEIVIRCAKYRRSLRSLEELRARLLLTDPSDEEIVHALRKMAMDVKANA